MENIIVSDLSYTTLINELAEARDLTRELQLNLSNEPCSNEAYGLIAKNILAKFERSLQILKYDPLEENQFQHTGKIGSFNSFSGSPKSQDSDTDFNDLIDHKNYSKKRRICARATQRVPACTSSGLEGPIEDGYNWRKYGQKDILGANFPRAYYRCTYKDLQGCVATKQVQRSDDDPSFFEVSYRGKHTCSQASSSTSSSNPSNTNPSPKIEPIETTTFSPNHSQKIMWDFKRPNLNDIKPIITTNVNHNKSSSSSNLLVNNNQKNPTSTTMFTHNYSDNFVVLGNFVTNTSNYTYQSPTSLMIKNNGFNNNYHNNYQETIDHPQEVVHTSSNSDTISTPIASEISFDHQGDCDDDFILHNSHIF